MRMNIANHPFASNRSFTGSVYPLCPLSKTKMDGLRLFCDIIIKIACHQVAII
jgi:hypothetical protein